MKQQIERISSLTPMQTGMFFHKMLDNNTRQYILQQAVRVEYSLDEACLRGALALLIDRHDVLRTNFVLPKSSGIPRQVVLAQKEPELYIENLSSLSPDEQTARIREIKQQDLERGFNIERDILLRVALLKLSARKSVMLWTFHHIIVDGWCLSLLYTDFMRYYRDLSQGISKEELVLEVERRKAKSKKFADYLDWLQNIDTSDGIAFWRDLLAGYDTVAHLPSLHLGGGTGGLVDTVELQTSPELTEELINISNTHGVTLASMLETALGIVLQQYNNTQDVVFGKVTSGRDVDMPGVEQVVGLLINTVPVRARYDEEMSLLDALQAQQKQTIDSNSYSYCSLAEIQQCTELGGNLFSVLFAMENYHVDGALNEISTELGLHVEEMREQTNYPINIKAMYSGRVVLQAMYDPEKYAAQETLCFLERMKHVLEAMAKDLNQKAVEVCLVGEAEKKLLLEQFCGNAVPYPKDSTITDLFEKFAHKNPSQTALLCNETEMSYATLNEKANQLANRLVSMGIEQGDLVAIFGGRTFEFYIAVLGIWKAGAAYVPLDKSYPDERIEYILQDCKPKALLLAGESTPAGNLAPVLNLMDGEAYNQPSTCPNLRRSPSDLAYCIYTSGTTGKPKGTLLEHTGICNLSNYMRYHYKITPKDTVLAFANVVFDASVLEMCMSLFSGARLCLVPEEVILEKKLYNEYLKRHNVTIALQPPFYYLQMKTDSLRILLTGGSASNFEVVRQAAQNMWYVNVYGPTETSVAVTLWDFPPGQAIPATIPIGKPMGNAFIYVLDHNRLCGIGMPGELCVAGVALSRGYLNQQEMTQEKFVPNPFGEGNMYRTGDLVRWLPDGNLEYLERMDDQVKIRGFRIELQEVEQAIRNLDGVNDVAVIARSSVNSDTEINAYILGDSVLNIGELSRRLSEVLPDYMVPAHIQQLDALPMNASGKLDKKALPSAGFIAHDAAAPRNDTERTIAELFVEVLGVTEIGTEDDFFDLGGNSIKAMQIAAKLSNEGIEIGVKDIFLYRTVARLAQSISEKTMPKAHNDSVDSDTPPLRDENMDIALSEPIPAPSNSQDNQQKNKLLPVKMRPTEKEWDALLQQAVACTRKYAFELEQTAVQQESRFSPSQMLSYKMGIVTSFATVNIDAEFDPDRFQAAWHALLKDFSLLCSSLCWQDGQGYILRHAITNAPLVPYIDLGTSFAQAELKEKLCLALLKDMPLPGAYTSPVAAHRILCIKGADKGFCVMIPVSHLVFDAFSNDILSQRLRQLYETPQVYGRGIPDYDSYTQLAEAGPHNTSEAELMSVLELERFERAIDQYRVLQQTGQYVRTSVEIPLDARLDYSSVLQFAQVLIQAAMKKVFLRSRIPVLMVHSGRNYNEANFSGVVGEFIDFLPFTYYPASGDTLFQEMDKRIRYMRQHNVNVASLIMNPVLAKKYPTVSRILNKINFERLNVRVLNLLVMYQAAIQIPPEEDGQTDMSEDMYTVVMRTENALLLRNVECRAGGEEEMKQYLTRIAEMYTQNACASR